MLVLAENNTEGDRSSWLEQVYHKNIHGSRVIRIYKKRWQIKCYHRAAKQSLGLGNYHGRKLRGLVAHMCLVALAHLPGNVKSGYADIIRGDAGGYRPVRSRPSGVARPFPLDMRRL